MIEVKWAGVDRSNRRVWGYLVDKKEESLFQYYDVVKTFWGHKNGRLYFQRTRADKTFWKNASKKKDKYNVHDTTLHDKVREEYEQLQIMRKLRNGF
jgi:hypothetical protein